MAKNSKTLMFVRSETQHQLLLLYGDHQRSPRHKYYEHLLSCPIRIVEIGIICERSQKRSFSRNVLVARIVQSWLVGNVASKDEQAMLVCIKLLNVRLHGHFILELEMLDAQSFNVENPTQTRARISHWCHLWNAFTSGNQSIPSAGYLTKGCRMPHQPMVVISHAPYE